MRTALKTSLRKMGSKALWGISNGRLARVGDVGVVGFFLYLMFA